MCSAQVILDMQKARQEGWHRTHMLPCTRSCGWHSNKSAASDVLAWMDQAISDGIDIMSLSLGFDFLPYYNDIIAIGSLSVVEKGIVVLCAAGNDGPSLEGESYFPKSVYSADKPLYYGKDSVRKSTCDFGALDQKEVAEKVLFCDNPRGGGIDGQLEEVRNAFTIPALILPMAKGYLIKEYATRANTTQVKTLTFVNTNLGTKPASQVAFLSSRGPDPITPRILKPDIIAPGVDVLAAVAPNKRFMEVNNYNLASDYQLILGTSMAAPHVAGAVALLKAVHHEWSPAAIRSAIMTTAYNLDNTGNTIKDYIEFLCGLGYTTKQMSAVIRRNQWSCRQQPTELNYPSFIAIFNGTDNSPKAKNFTRVVTNVRSHFSSSVHSIPQESNPTTNPIPTRPIIPTITPNNPTTNNNTNNTTIHHHHPNYQQQSDQHIPTILQSPPPTTQDYATAHPPPIPSRTHFDSSSRGPTSAPTATNGGS
nr:subtilisin-like protease SBT1.8 [Malus domestica]